MRDAEVDDAVVAAVRHPEAGAITVAIWLLIAGVVATSDTQRFPTYDVVIEVAALAALVVLVGPAFPYGSGLSSVDIETGDA